MRSPGLDKVTGVAGALGIKSSATKITSRKVLRAATPPRQPCSGMHAGFNQLPGSCQGFVLDAQVLSQGQQTNKPQKCTYRLSCLL